MSLFILISILTKELTKMRSECEDVTNIVLFLSSGYDVMHNHNISLSVSVVESCMCAWRYIT